MAKLHKLVSSSDLNPDYNLIIFEFMIQWDNLHHLYGLSYTNKIHIIQDHLSEQLEKRDRGLKDVSDEHVEAVHHRLREHEERHQYWATKIGSPAQGKKQHKMIVHWNSKNI